MRGRIKTCHDVIRNSGVVCNPLGSVRKPTLRVTHKGINERVRVSQEDRARIEKISK